MTTTQPTAEQLRMARECAVSVLGERYQALIGKDTKDKIPELRARICKVRCGEGDHLTEVQSALLAIQATEARMAAAVEAERERILVIVADQKKAANESDKWPKYHGMAGSYMQGAYVNACANIEAAIRSADDGQG